MPQSAGQLAWDSPQAGWHWPFPQTHTAPQSCGQFCWFSMQMGWQTPFPQVQVPQSCGQLVLVLEAVVRVALAVAAGAHDDAAVLGAGVDGLAGGVAASPSPQMQLPPQSTGQLFEDSTHCGWQTPLPQRHWRIGGARGRGLAAASRRSHRARADSCRSRRRR